MRAVRPRPRRRAAFGFLLTGLSLVGAGGAAQADLLVQNGASLTLGPGTLYMGCGDVVISGTIDGGLVGIREGRDLTIGPSGTLFAGLGLLEFSGDWTNQGIFVAGGSEVRMSDGCGIQSATIAGSTTFAGLTIQSASGRQQRFVSGESTTVTGNLTLTGVEGALLELRSTALGQASFLGAQGASNAQFIDIDDIDATGGNPITVGDDSIVGGNAPGWNLAAMVPLLGPAALALLGATLVWWGRRAIRIGA